MSAIVDPYLEPGTECLRNKLGIRDAGLLAVVEAEVVANRAIRLANSPGLVLRTWDWTHWQNLHRHLFGDVYDWAGEFRTVDIAKDGHGFHPVSMLITATRYCAEQIRALATGPNPGRGQLPARLSVVLSDMNEAHPFREGNGRTQRVLLGQIAEVHGAHLDWTLISSDPDIAARFLNGV